MRAWLDAVANAALRKEVRNHPGNETGGLLLGYWSSDEAVITDIIGPGPKAVRSTNTFHPDASWQEQELATRYAASGRLHSYLGDWHVHPGGTTTLSRTDRRTLARISRHEPARAQRPLIAVIAPDAEGTLDLWCFNGRWRRARRLVVVEFGMTGTDNDVA